LGRTRGRGARRGGKRIEKIVDAYVVSHYEEIKRKALKENENKNKNRYKHMIVKSKKIKEKRISITYRNMK
jgi:hypothetical protein